MGKRKAHGQKNTDRGYELLLKDDFLIHLPDLSGLLRFPRCFASSLFFFRSGEGNVVF